MGTLEVVQYRSRARSIVTILTTLFLALYLIWTLMPFLIMLVSSFKDLLEAFTLPEVGDFSGVGVFFEFTPTTAHYTELFTERNFSVYFFNSVVVSSGSALYQ